MQTALKPRPIPRPVPVERAELDDATNGLLDRMERVFARHDLAPFGLSQVENGMVRSLSMSALSPDRRTYVSLCVLLSSPNLPVLADLSSMSAAGSGITTTNFPIEPTESAHASLLQLARCRDLATLMRVHEAHAASCAVTREVLDDDPESWQRYCERFARMMWDAPGSAMVRVGDDQYRTRALRLAGQVMVLLFFPITLPVLQFINNRKAFRRLERIGCTDAASVPGDLSEFPRR